MIRSRLKKISNAVRRVGKLKEGGINAYTEHPEVQSKVASVVEECKKFGLFLVPSGELENWVPHLTDGISTSESKLERAYEMAARIRTSEDKSGDVWAFTQGILDYFEARL
jgi:hypothetical protein